MNKIESVTVSEWIPSPNWHSPKYRRVKLIVLHSIESPLTQGYTVAIARNWFGKAASEVSSHYISGPAFNVQCVEERNAAWTVGKYGNPITINIEQPGRASFSRAQWLTGDGRKMIRNTAELVSDISVRHGGPRAPARASRAQIKAYAQGQAMPGGVRWCTHDDIRRSLGGTTHTDPGPNYPYDVFEADMRGGTIAAAGPGGTYTVVKGDTLWAIADALKVKLPALVKLNSITNPALIHPGQKLDVPGNAAKPPVRKPSKPAASIPYEAPPGKWPLDAGEFFGSITGGKKSRGGFHAWEEKWVKWIQLGMVALGYARTKGGKHTRSRGWADGKFGPPTVKAVARWQKDKHASTTSLPGEIWSDDFRNLEHDWKAAS